MNIHDASGVAEHSFQNIFLSYLLLCLAAAS